MALSSRVWSILILSQVTFQARAGVMRDSRTAHLLISPVESLQRVTQWSDGTILQLEGKTEHDQSQNDKSEDTSDERAPDTSREKNSSGPIKNRSQRDIRALREHGAFNPDTYACDDIDLRSCEKASDCDGCLGLFMCKMPQGKCDLKGVSRSTAQFFESLKSS